MGCCDFIHSNIKLTPYAKKYVCFHRKKKYDQTIDMWRIKRGLTRGAKGFHISNTDLWSVNRVYHSVLWYPSYIINRWFKPCHRFRLENIYRSIQMGNALRKGNALSALEIQKTFTAHITLRDKQDSAILLDVKTGKYSISFVWCALFAIWPSRFACLRDVVQYINRTPC